VAIDLTPFREQYPDLPSDVPDDVLLSAIYEKFYYREGVSYKDFEEAVQKKYGVEEPEKYSWEWASKQFQPGKLKAPRLGQAIFGEPEGTKVSELPIGDQLVRIAENIGRGIFSLPDLPQVIAEGLKKEPWETAKTIAMFPPEQGKLLTDALANIPEAQEAIGEDPISPIFALMMAKPGISAVARKMKPKVSIYEAPVADITAAFEGMERMTSEIKTLARETYPGKPVVVETPKLAEMPKGKPAAKEPWEMKTKVTDEFKHPDYEVTKGEPLIVYHGSPTGKILKFDNAFLGDNTGAKTSHLGHFFTNDPKVAAGFSGKIKTDLSKVTEAQLDIRNPYVIKRTDPYIDPFDKLREWIKEDASDLGWAKKPENMSDVSIEDMRLYRNRLERRGYDGIIIENTAIDAVEGGHTMFIPFKESQIRIIKPKPKPTPTEAAKPAGEPVVVETPEFAELPKAKPRKQATEATLGHHKTIRGVDFIARELKRTVDQVVPDPARQDILSDYIEQPKVYESQLTPLEKKVGDILRRERDKVTEFIKKYKVLEPGIRPPGVDYLYHWWKDPLTGEPFNPHYGKFSESLPQAHQRKIATRQEGKDIGLEPASNNPGELIGVTWKSVIRAQQSRQMFKSLHKIEAGTEAMIRMQEGKSRPSRIVENWDTIRRRGEPSEYVEYEKWPTLKGKMTVGIHKNAYPHIRAYFESPSYGTLARAVFVTKAIKLGMSMFHPMALAVQAVTAGMEPISLIVKGNKLIKKGGEVLGRGYRNGLELHEYADVGLDYLRSSNKLVDVGLAPTRASANFIFRVIHPGLRAGHFWVMYNKYLPEYLAKGLTKDQCARDMVLKGDRLFSGEDYKQTMLESSEFMAKYWYSPSARKGLQMALISPMWQKAHGIMAGATVKSFIPKKVRAKIGLSESRPIDKAYRAYFGRAMGIYIQANLWNWIWTKELDGEGRLMWQNKAPFSIRAPYNEPDGHKAYWRPLKSIFEVPEFLPRPGHWTAPLTKIGHKLTPVWQAAASQLWNFSYTGKRYEDEGIANLAERAMDVFGDVLTPISVGQLGLGEIITDPEKALQRKGMTSRLVGAVGIPPSRGLNTYDAVKLFEKAYKRGDKEEIDRIKQELRDNGYSNMVIKRTYNRARKKVYDEKHKPKNLIQHIISK
jgi:hypothetical protein